MTDGIQNYPTGADIQVFLTSGQEPTLYRDQPLDIVAMTIIEDGTVLPLYDYVDYLSKHVAYSARMVTGSLVFNYSEAHGQNYRSGSWARPEGLQSIHNQTLWVYLSKAEWGPDPRIVRDLIRIDHVWEHPFRHEVDPVAQEQVPFSARSLQLVRRETRTIDPSSLGAFVADPTRFVVSGQPLFRSEEQEFRGLILRVIDADTFVVKISGQEALYRVRLPAIDAPEDPWKGFYHPDDGTPTKIPPPPETTLDSGSLTSALVAANPPDPDKPPVTPGLSNSTNDARRWRWPAEAPPRDPIELGVGAGQPTTDQLDVWGRFATLRTTEMLEGKTVRLVRDTNIRPRDDHNRLLLQVHTLDGTDIERWLIQQGLAHPFPAASMTLREGQFTSRIAILKEDHKAARAKAGTAEARGIWYTFDPGYWEANR